MYLKKQILFFLLSCVSLYYSSGQLNFEKKEGLFFSNTKISDIAYKLPYRGENYKFYGTLKFHIYGNAFVNNGVYNTFIEAQHLSKYNLPKMHIRIFKSSGKNFGYLNQNKSSVSGNRIVFMTPMTKNGQAVKYYYRTGIFRMFYRFDASGNTKTKHLNIDFDSLAQYLINLDDAAHFFGLKIETVTVKREFIKTLYNTSSGKELKCRDIRFIKYLSRKMNKKYEELFLVVFEAI